MSGGLSYTNGAAPDSALVFVDGIHVTPDVAERLVPYIAWAKKREQAVRVAHWLGGYRNLHEQGELSGTGNTASTIPVAAVGSSTHGNYMNGRVDLVGADGLHYNATDLAFFIATAPLFGFTREFGNKDPNHFKVTGPIDPSVFAEPATQEVTVPHTRAIVYQIVGDNGGLNGVKIAVGSDLTVLPDDNSANIYASVFNHGLESFPDFKAGGPGDGQPLPMNKQNADWIAAGYGPQIPGGTIAYLWNLAHATGQPATYVPTVAAQLDQAALSKTVTDALTAAVKATQPDDVAAIANAVKAAFGQALS